MTIYSRSNNAEEFLKQKAFATLDTEKDNNLFYGVELELECREGFNEELNIKNIGYAPEVVSNIVDKNFGGYAMVKTECLLDGFEIVTVPATLKVHKALIWENFFNDAVKYLKASSRTGMHIHFSRNAVTDKQLAKALFFMHEYTNESFLSDIAGRTVSRTSGFCWQRKKDYNGTDGSVQDIITQENQNGRGSLSISAHNRGKTVEARIFRSVTSYQGVMQALEFMDALLVYCAYCSDLEESLSGKSLVNWFILENQKEIYPHLHANLVRMGYSSQGLASVQAIKEFVKSLVKSA